MKDSKFLIQILGKPQVLMDGHVRKVERRKTRAIIYYIAAQRYPVSRQELLALLWPDQVPSAAQHTLSVVLHDLRKSLCGLLVIDNNLLSFAPNVIVDARVFEERLSHPVADLDQINEVLHLYRGGFLEDFDLPNALEYCYWLDAERERYERMAIRGLAVAAELYEIKGKFHLALKSLERALELNPLQEDLHRSCMRLYYLAGDRPGMIMQYQKLCKLLNEEMGVPPMPQTKALYDAIITDTSRDTIINHSANSTHGQAKRLLRSPRPQPPDLMPFAGRKNELRTMHELARKKNIKIILIEGQPGIGKTRLSEEFIRESDELIIRGTAHELEQILPYQPILEALRGLISSPDWPTLNDLIQSNLALIWREEIERLIPEMKSPVFTEKSKDMTTDKHQLWEAIRQFLLVIAHHRPVIFFLDDLQWADDSTLGLLSYLVRQTRDEPIKFVGITRPFNRKSGLAKLMQAITREVQLVRLVLQPLLLDDVTFLAQHYSSSNTNILVGWLMRISEGNPYFLKEVVQFMLENALLSTSGRVNTEALSATTVVPTTVHNFISMRLERFSETARRVLDTAAVIGREFSFAVLVKAVALSEDAALDGLEELCSQGLIQTVGGSQYTFDHSLTREVAFSEIDTSRCQSLHRRIAEALESMKNNDLDSVAGMIAWHFTKSNVAERAAPYALRAGNHSLRLAAWNEAIAFYEQALTYLEDSDRISVLHHMGIMFTADIKGSRASEIYRKAAVLAQSQGKVAYSEYYLGVALTVESPDFSEILWGMAPVLPVDALPEAKKHLKTAETLLAEANLVELEPSVKLVLGLLEAIQGNLRQAVSYCREGLTIALNAENEDTMLRIILVIKMNLSALLQILDDPMAHEIALSGLNHAQEKGMLFIQPQLLSVLGKIALGEKKYESAEKYFTKGLALAEQMSMLSVVSDITDCLGQLALVRGQKELAVSQFLKALNSADTLGMHHQAIQIRMRLASFLPPAEARARLAEVRNLVQGRAPCMLERVNRLETEIGNE